MTANVPVKFLFEVSNNMVSGDDSVKKGTQLSLIEASYNQKNNWDLDMISLFLLNVLLLAGSSAKLPLGVTLRWTSIPFREGIEILLAAPYYRD